MRVLPEAKEELGYTLAPVQVREIVPPPKTWQMTRRQDAGLANNCVSRCGSGPKT